MSSDNLFKGNGVLFNPEVGSTYKYEIDEVKEIEQAIGNKENKVKLTVNSEISLVYKILKKINNNYEVLVQFENCTMGSHSGEDIERDSATLQKSIEAFKGATFTFNIVADGRVENIKGLKEFKEKFATNAVPDSSYTEEYFKDIFERISSILPDKIVFINSSWLHKDTLEIGEIKSLNARYTLDSIHAGTAYIKTTSPVEQTIAALNHSVKMSGIEKGAIEVEAETGILITRTQKSAINGSLKIGEVDVDMNVNRSSTIMGKKIL